MSHQSKSELIRTKMQEAEAALAQYFLASTYDAEREKRLYAAANAARQEYIDHLAKLCPTEATFP